MADSDKEVTYLDDEFGSDGETYEAEYEEHEGESDAVQVAEELPTHGHDDTPDIADAEEAEGLNELKISSDALQDQPTTLDLYDGEFEESVDGKPAELAPDIVPTAGIGDSAGDEETTRVELLESVATTPPREFVAESLAETEAERLEPNVQLSETSEHAATVASHGENPEEKEVVEKRPQLLGQLAKPASVRSLSVPVVPAASLVDPSLLIPSNLRSTSVPVVPSNEIIGIHRENSGRFQIETVTGSTARHKSIVRLPSVEELEAQGAMDSDEESEGVLESDDADDSRAATPPSPLSAGFPRGRSSSFQLNQLNQPKTSPVLRTKSQPFMARLPSVIEVTTEEVLLIESLRNDDGETKSDEKKHSESSEDETGMDEKESGVKLEASQNEPLAIGTPAELSTSEAAANPESTEANGIEVTTTPAQAEDGLQTETASVSEPAEAVISSVGPSQESSGPSDECEDNYEDQRQLDIAEQSVAEGNGAVERKTLTESQGLLSEFGEFSSVEEANYNDDEYGGENEEFSDFQFEEESRRETELLLREAQMLIQKQHEDRSDRRLLPTLQSESPDILDQSEVPDNSEPTILPPARYEDIEEAITSTRASSTTVPNFEDQYGGDDEFVNADEDGDADDFDQYASDRDDASDTDEPQELRDSVAERKPSENAILGEPTLAFDSASPASPTVSELIVSPVTATQMDSSHPEASQAAETLGGKSVGLQHTTNQDLPPDIAPSASPTETEHVEKSEPAASETTSSTKLQQNSKPIARLDSATQKPTRVLPTRPSRPIAAAAAPRANEPRASRPARPVTQRRKVEIAESVLKRERPRELRLKAERSDAQPTTTQASSYVTPPPRSAQTLPEEKKDREPDIASAPPEPSLAPSAQETNAEMESSHSPERDVRRSPERIPAYTPRVYVEEYEPPPPKAPVFKQMRVKRPRTEDSRRKLQPVKSPPNFRIDLPSMDKTKRNWLFLNMFRHGDDVSKYETFVPKLVSPCLTQAAGRPVRPHSASQQTYANSQAEAITAYGGGRRSQNGRKLVQQDPALRERERNWMPIKPHESAIPTYDSILDKFCTTVTSPVIQRQIYQTRHDDLSPQLAYVLEKRVEKQWRNGAAEAFGAVNSSYKTDVVQSPSCIDKKSPSRACSISSSM